MISNSLANATFSEEPKDYLLEFIPVTVESAMPLDCVPSMPAVSYVDHWQHSSSNSSMPIITSSMNERKRAVAEIEPTPIGPRNSVKVVDEIPVEDIISLDQCEDILVETFLMERPTSCQSFEFEHANKRRKFATVTPRSSITGTTCSTTMTEPLLFGGWDDAVVSDEDLSSIISDEQPLCSRSSSSSTLVVKPDQWYEKYQELCAFHAKYGHCLVPNKTPEGNYQSLSQWVKRQRHQHKLKRLGRHSTLTEDREASLRKLDFVWDSHGATWNERFRELLQFKASRGHCNVPTEFPENPQLSIWVKCQRRQYKLHLTGKKSNINPSRISKLNEINFVWNPRNLKV